MSLNLHELIEKHRIVEPFAEYNAKRPGHLTSHQYIKFEKDPALANVKSNISESAAILGAAFHCFILDMEEFHKDFALEPDWLDEYPELQESKNYKRSKRFKEIKSQWLEENKDKHAITYEQFDVIAEQHAAYEADDDIQYRLNHGYEYNESTFRTKIHGQPIQIRPDQLLVQKDTYDLVDVKTIQDFDRWKYHIRNYGYDVQLYFYGFVLGQILGVFPENLLIHFVEKQEPYRTMEVEILPSISANDGIYNRISDTIEKFASSDFSSKYKTETYLSNYMEE